jgi:hypothetical protein
MDVNLGFQAEQQEGYVLYQNRPNPFSTRTVVGFHLPEATRATLKVWDAQGQLVFQTAAEYPAGYHEVLLEDLPAARLLYYRLETPVFTATRKMIQDR